MFLIIFTKPRIKELGSVSGYEIFMTAQTLYIFFIPTISWGRQYYAKSADGKLLLLTEEAGKAIRRGEKDVILQEDILSEKDPGIGEEVRYGASSMDYGWRGRPKKCPYCGFTTTENYNYCPKCAEKLEYTDEGR